MASVNLQQASQILDDLIPVLDDMYWEASTVDHKDMIYNLIRLITDEAIELHKVSVQDGHYPYESVTEIFPVVRSSMTPIRENLSRICRRTKTEKEASEHLQRLTKLLK